MSGAEEKIFRVFQAPVSFFENLKSLCGITLDEVCYILQYFYFLPI